MTAKDRSRGKNRVLNVNGSTSTQHSPHADLGSRSTTHDFSETDEGEDQDMVNPSSIDGVDGGPDESQVPTDHRLELTLEKRWFTDNSVVRAVSHCIRCHYTEANTCWSKTPGHIKDQWFKFFKMRYTWKAELEYEVKKGFKEVGQKRLRQMVSKAASATEAPAWMGGDLHTNLHKVRDEPEFKVRSERARKNRLSNLAEDGEKIDPGHHQGSMSGVTLAGRMANKNKNKLPTASELWAEAHSIKDKDGKREIVGKKALQVQAKLDQLLEKAKQTETGTPKNPDEMFFEAVGGWKKGVVQGLGTAASLYFKKPETRSVKSAAAHYSPSEIASLHERLNDNERLMKEQKEFFETQLAHSRAQVDEQRDFNASLAKQIELMTRAIRDNCGSQLAPFEPRDHPDPDGSVGSAAS